MNYVTEVREWRGQQFEQAGMKFVGSADGEQITIEEAALHLRLDSDGNSPLTYDQETWLEVAISTAREVVEGLTGLLLAPQAVVIGRSGFPNAWQWGQTQQAPISLITGPLIGITEILYRDADGAEQTMTDGDYELDDFVRPPRIHPVYGGSWPSAVQAPNSVQIECRMGYDLPGGSPQDRPLPSSLKNAMLLVLAHLYENRESTTDLKLEALPMGVTALCERYRIRTSMA